MERGVYVRFLVKKRVFYRLSFSSIFKVIYQPSDGWGMLCFLINHLGPRAPHASFIDPL